MAESTTAAREITVAVKKASGLVAGMSAAFLTATVISLAAVVLSAMMRKTPGAGPAHAAH